MLTSPVSRGEYGRLPRPRRGGADQLDAGWRRLSSMFPQTRGYVNVRDGGRNYDARTVMGRGQQVATVATYYK